VAIVEKTQQSKTSVETSIDATLDQIDAHLYALDVRPLQEQQDVNVPVCPICDSASATPTFSVEGVQVDVVVCDSCGLGRLHPMPSPEEIAAFYPPDYYGDSGGKFHRLTEKMVRWVASRRAQFLCRGLLPGDRVLDVGCGRGVLLEAFANAGLEAHGFEISPDAARGVDDRAHIRTAGSLPQAEYPSQFFDRVVIWHVLEHVRAPRATISEIHRILKPGGQIVVAVPNFSSWQAQWAKADWFHLDLPRHLYQFPLDGLKQLLSNCEFDVQSEHHFSLRQNPFGWVQSSLNRSRVVPRNSLYVMLQRGQTGSVSALGRFRAWLMHYLGMPVALGISLVAAMFRRGASVHVVATAKK
jgi:SAM-dependent methyltransferase